MNLKKIIKVYKAKEKSKIGQLIYMDFLYPQNNKKEKSVSKTTKLSTLNWERSNSNDEIPEIEIKLKNKKIELNDALNKDIFYEDIEKLVFDEIYLHVKEVIWNNKLPLINKIIAESCILHSKTRRGGANQLIINKKTQLKLIDYYKNNNETKHITQNKVEWNDILIDKFKIIINENVKDDSILLYYYSTNDIELTPAILVYNEIENEVFYNIVVTDSIMAGYFINIDISNKI